MKFQTRPTQVDAYRVGTPDANAALQHHTSAFESRNLWDCWELRTPEDSIELVTKGDWVVIEDEERIYPITLRELLDRYTPLEPPTNCLNCGDPTNREAVHAPPAQPDGALCPNCIHTTR